MLRSGLAAPRALERQVVASSSTIFVRSAMQWRHRGKSTPSSRKGAGSRPNRKSLSQLEINERQTLREIKELEAKLATQGKSEEARKAHEQLGEYDDQTLEEVYAAINSPDPPLEEDLRLEARRRRRRSAVLFERHGSNVFLNTWHGARLIQRLAALRKRIELLDRSKPDELVSGPSTSAYERKPQLWQSLMVPDLTTEEPLSTGLGGVDQFNQAQMLGEGRAVLESQEVREALLKQVESLTTAWLDKTPTKQQKTTLELPLGIATSQEWGALSTCFALNDDREGVRRIIKAARENRQPSSVTRAANAALDVFASKGAWEVCQDMLAWMKEQDVVPTSYTYHCIVKSFVRANRFEEVFDLLRGWEDQAPASIGTYTFVISSLIQQTGRPALQSRVWPLFQRMRLVAHPIPDAPCYAQMIRACAMGIPQPSDALWKPTNSLLPKHETSVRNGRPGRVVVDTERALDLLREMTDRYSIRPTPEVYSALILACGRRKDMYEKALQLFGNMVEMERERLASIQLAQDRSQEAPSYAPTRETFNAVLSGCARSADLMRARWILAEMLRSAAKRWEEIMSAKGEGGALEPWEVEEFEERLPNAETLSKVFYTYASYEPRTHTIVRGRKTHQSEVGMEEPPSQETQAIQETKSQIITDEGDSVIRETVMTHQIPQTKAAILREAKALMERIKIDHKEEGGLLSVVRPDAALINSFISVLSKHAKETELLQHMQEILYASSPLPPADDLALGEKQMKSLFQYFDIEPNGHTYEAVLEACGRMDKSDEALRMALRVWKDWELLSKGTKFKSALEAQKLGLTSVTISRTWSAMIHVLAKNDRLDAAMDKLRQFASLYPPSLSSASSATSSYPTLMNAATLRPHRDRSQVLLSEYKGEKASSSTIQPSLTFKQIEVLHMRLVERENRAGDINFVTWLLKSYRSSSQPKKPESLQGVTLMNRQAAIRELLERRNSSPMTSAGVYRG